MATSFNQTRMPLITHLDPVDLADLADPAVTERPRRNHTPNSPHRPARTDMAPLGVNGVVLRVLRHLSSTAARGMVRLRGSIPLMVSSLPSNSSLHRGINTQANTTGIKDLTQRSP